MECQRWVHWMAADAGKSFVRKHIDVPFEGETWKDERMYVGDVRLRGLDRDAWHSWPNHPDGWLALCPLPSPTSSSFRRKCPRDEREPSLEFRDWVKARAGGTQI